MQTQQKTQVKICGLTRATDVAYAIKAGAEFLGFVIECPSKRRLSVAQAAKIAPPTLAAARVAVTVNPDDALLSRIMAEMAPDFIQLHGDETLERVAEISKNFQVKTIKAVPISSPADMASAEAYAGSVEFLLYDAKPAPDQKVRGGHGRVIDWALIAQAPTPKRFALAGGLNASNVAKAVTITHAPIVDVSSSVEARAGVKSAAKITAFMDAVKNG